MFVELALIFAALIITLGGVSLVDYAGRTLPASRRPWLVSALATAAFLLTHVATIFVSAFLLYYLGVPEEFLRVHSTELGILSLLVASYVSFSVFGARIVGR